MQTTMYLLLISVLMAGTVLSVPPCPTPVTIDDCSRQIPKTSEAVGQVVANVKENLFMNALQLSTLQYSDLCKYKAAYIEFLNCAMDKRRACYDYRVKDIYPNRKQINATVFYMCNHYKENWNFGCAVKIRAPIFDCTRNATYDTVPSVTDEDINETFIRKSCVLFEQTKNCYDENLKSCGEYALRNQQFARNYFEKSKPSACSGSATNPSLLLLTFLHFCGLMAALIK